MFCPRTRETDYRRSEKCVLVLLVERIVNGSCHGIAFNVSEAQPVKVNGFIAVVEKFPVAVVDECAAACGFRSVSVNLAEYNVAFDGPYEVDFPCFSGVGIGKEIDLEQVSAQHDVAFQVSGNVRSHFPEFGIAQCL